MPLQRTHLASNQSLCHKVVVMHPFHGHWWTLKVSFLAAGENKLMQIQEPYWITLGYPRFKVLKRSCGLLWCYSKSWYVPVKKYFFWIIGCGRMEYWQSEHPPRHGGTRVWYYYRRCKHSVPLLWDVEDNVCLAYRGHGSLQYQLPAFWGAKILVSGRVLIDADCVPLLCTWRKGFCSDLQGYPIL